MVWCTKKNQYTLCAGFLFVHTMEGLEQGSGAQRRKQSHRAALLSLRVPTARNVYRGSCGSKDFMAFLFCEPWVHGCGKSETYLQKIQDGKDEISY